MKSKLFALERGDQGALRFKSRERNYTIAILYLLVGLALIYFVILALRLFQLTVVKGNYYRGLSENNRVKEIIIEPARGTITDRHGTVLAENIPADYTQDGERISSPRKYLSPEVASHIMGYRQIADENDMENDQCLTKLNAGDKVGKKGVEKLYDCALRGKNGKKMIEVDATGNALNTLSVIDPVPGETVTLALDLELQKKAYEAIKGKKAVVVAQRPQTGEVLALASWPAYDPQVFEDNDTKQIEAYFTDEDKPLFNRATEGTYPPGSVYKMAVTTAALEEGVVTPSTLIEDKGVLEVGPAKYHNWYFLKYGRTDGQVDAVKALQRSNDIYYYKIGEKLGPEQIKSWAEQLGFEQSTGIGIAESAGTIPSPFWKKDVLNEDWFTGDTYNMSIGQGYTLVTPLQINMHSALYANGGYLCKPELSRIGGNQGVEQLKDIEPQCTKMPISDSTLDVIRQGMVKACQPGGTGTPFFEYEVRDPQLLAQVTPTPSVSPEATDSALLAAQEASPSAGIDIMKPVPVACKTGTAESFGEGFDPHAWFTIYAPLDDPEIIMTVLVEEGGEGSEVAAPIAKEILTSYFERKEDISVVEN
jgi:penicillin-binding protein 2